MTARDVAVQHQRHGRDRPTVCRLRQLYQRKHGTSEVLSDQFGICLNVWTLSFARPFTKPDQCLHLQHHLSRRGYRWTILRPQYLLSLRMGPAPLLPEQQEARCFSPHCSRPVGAFQSADACASWRTCDEQATYELLFLCFQPGLHPSGDHLVR